MNYELKTISVMCHISPLPSENLGSQLIIHTASLKKYMFLKSLPQCIVGGTHTSLDRQRETFHSGSAFL